MENQVIDKSGWNYVHHILDLLKAKQDLITIFECGCHWGEDTERLVRMCGSKPVRLYGFEPDIRNIEIIKAKNFPANVKIYPLAISDRVGYADLYLSEGVHKPTGNRMTGANSIRKPKEVLRIYDWFHFLPEPTKVPTTTIDSFCRLNEIDHIDFIWCDIQGSEYYMIQGANRMLPKIDMMLLEYDLNELYEGQKMMADILELLGSNWEMIWKGSADILVKRIK